MRHTIIVATLSSVAASVLTTVVISGSLFGTSTASSANTPVEPAVAVSPGGLESILQGDVDCGGNVTPVDSLKTLRHDAGLSVLQDEPCPDIATVIPTGEGVPGPQGPQEPQGEQGPAGPQGEQGLPGLSDVERVFESFTSVALTKSVVVSCPEGKEVLGGGGQTGGANPTDTVLTDSYPLSGARWQVKAEKTSGLLQEWQLTAYAVCANVGE